MQVAPHTYQVTGSFGSRGQGQGKLNIPLGVAVSEKAGSIVVADGRNRRVQLWDSEWKYLRSIGDKSSGNEIIDMPRSVAFTASGDVIVIHGGLGEDKKMSVFTEHGDFITHITEHLVSPSAVSVDANGNLVVCNRGDKTVKVLSPDGRTLIQSARDPYSDEAPEFAVYHQDMFFVSYKKESCVKVLNKDGQLLYKIGCKGTADGQLRDPSGFTIDRFGNLVVCDCGNKRIQVFSIDGKLLNSVSERMISSTSVSATENGDLLVCDLSKNCIHILH